MGNRNSVKLVNVVNNVIKVIATPTTGNPTPASYTWEVNADDNSVQTLSQSWKSLTGEFNVEVKERNSNGQWITKFGQEIGPFDIYTVTTKDIQGSNN